MKVLTQGFSAGIEINKLTALRELQVVNGELGSGFLEAIEFISFIWFAVNRASDTKAVAYLFWTVAVFLVRFLDWVIILASG